MNKKTKEMIPEELDIVSGGVTISDLYFKCPYCSFTSPKTPVGAKEMQEHIEICHPDK